MCALDVYCTCMYEWGRRGVSCLLILMCVQDGCARVSPWVWCFSLTSHWKKSRLSCSSLHRISINLLAIYTLGTLITLLLHSPNNFVKTSENKSKYCTQLSGNTDACFWAKVPYCLIHQYTNTNYSLLILISRPFQPDNFQIPSPFFILPWWVLNYIKSKFSRLRKQLP